MASSGDCERDALEGVGLLAAALEHAHHLQPDVVDLDLGAERLVRSRRGRAARRGPITQTWAWSRSSSASRKRPSARRMFWATPCRPSTPNTVGLGPCPVGERTFQGSIAILGRPASTPGTACGDGLGVALGDAERAAADLAAALVVEVLARTRTLRRPSRSMSASASRSAPAPIDSMAITAPTPKIMPSMVSAERSLCAARLASAVARASRKSSGHYG